MKNDEMDYLELAYLTDSIKQDQLDYQAEQQKAYDEFMEWYQTVGCFEDEK